MSLFLEMLLAALICAFAENTIFMTAIGTSTLFVASKYPKQVFAFSLSITYINIISSIILYFSQSFIPYGELGYIYKPLVFVLIIGLVYILTLLFLWRFFDKLFAKLKKFIHLSAFNCIVLGTMFINQQNKKSLLDYVLYAFSVGLGFLIASCIVCMNVDKLRSDKVPSSFRGFPVTLIYIGIVSMLIFVLI